MKKESRKYIFILFLVLGILISVSFVHASIDTKNSRGLTTTSFFTSDEVFLKSSTGLCNSIYQNIDVYIIKSGDEVLADVRGKPEELNLTSTYQIPANTKIWADPVAGDYDVIVDCDKNGAYHPLEPKTSFSVDFKKGSGNVSMGSEIKNNSWRYDAENEILMIEMLQLSISAGGEDIGLANISIKATGTGNDSQISALEVYVDTNNNGKLDENEALIGDSQPAYLQDNGETNLNLDYTLLADSGPKLLIVYTMNEDIEEGGFGLIVNSVYGIGKQSGELIKFSGLPINSNTLKVLPKQECLGSLALELTPNPAEEGESVLAKISNLTGCDDKTVNIKTKPCIYPLDVGYCILKERKCEIELKPTENNEYYACVDKNGDNDTLDFGETSSISLVVNSKTEKVTEEPGEFANVTNQTQGENATAVTGDIISQLFDSSFKNIFVLLEITLLLILVVLIIISIRIKGNRQERNKPEKKKSEGEE
ncbi:MAG: hypothetical protein PHH54_02500 [Candidatus Nanoarchaeia archaeon]|nr:hypothetical protein [Candidatus Nanoarchaeia archaeon]MDD5740832.1 hypothetical protein [Candidatus Nanoarchaeia archaeon]